MSRIKVLDAKALGDPGVLGTAEISLTDAQLQPNAGPRDMWLPLKVTLPLQTTTEHICICSLAFLVVGLISALCCVDKQFTLYSSLDSQSAAGHPNAVCSCKAMLTSCALH